MILESVACLVQQLICRHLRTTEDTAELVKRIASCCCRYCWRSKDESIDGVRKMMMKKAKRAMRPVGAPMVVCVIELQQLHRPETIRKTAILLKLSLLILLSQTVCSLGLSCLCLAGLGKLHRPQALHFTWPRSVVAVAFRVVANAAADRVFKKWCGQGVRACGNIGDRVLRWL